MAGAMRLFGVDEWVARAPHALWFAATALVLGALAGRWWGRRAGLIAVAVYAGSLGPFLAANVLTPDTPLAFASAAAYYLYGRLEAERRPSRRLGWGALLGVALGLGALAKGPAMLVLAAPLALHAAMRRRRSLASLVEPGFAAAAAAALAVASPWYCSVVARLPGSLAYMFHNQVLGRLFTGEYARNSGPFDGLLVYVPTLLVGALPWSALWAYRLRRSRALPPPRAWLRLHRRPVALLVALWFVVPLAVFVAARSRLPLYVLPLFAPLSLVTARRLSLARSTPRPAARRRRLWLPATAAAWMAFLVGLKALAGVIDYPRDARQVAGALARRGIPATQLLVTVDTKKNGLAFYGYRRLEFVTTVARPYPFYVLPETLTEEVREIQSGEAAPLLLVSERQSPALVKVLTENLIPARSHRFVGSLSLVEIDAERSRAPASR
jgi:4-amino-4-deoxy-L-arabinose transferase